MFNNDAHRFFTQLVLQLFPAVFSLDYELIFHLELGLHLQILSTDLFIALKHELRQVNQLFKLFFVVCRLL